MLGALGLGLLAGEVSLDLAARRSSSCVLRCLTNSVGLNLGGRPVEPLGRVGEVAGLLPYPEAPGPERVPQENWAGVLTRVLPC